MATNVEEIYVPLGLITQPNKLGQYPAGALSQASGLAMRSPGLATRMPLLSTYFASPTIQVAPVVPHLLGSADSMLFTIGRRNADGQWSLTFFTASGALKFGNVLNVAGLPFSPITFDTTGRTAWTQQRGRYLFNSDQGVLITDTGTPSSNATAMPRHAGLQSPFLIVSAVTAGAVGAIDNLKQAAFVAIVRRVAADGYEIVSPPSAPQSSGSSFGPSDTLASTAWQANAGYVAGDVIEFYRTPQQAVDVAVGATYYLCGKYTLTGADIAAFQIVAPPTLTAKDAGLGAELYTNPGQTGFNSLKEAPPLAACMATFKGYTFYGNRQDTATLAMQVPAGFSFTLPSTDAFTRKNAIGTRPFTATFTNTSNVLTVISAADIVGLAIGQTVTDAALTGGQGTITAVGATTVTLSVTANSNVTKSTSSSDVYFINGQIVSAATWSFFTFGAVNTACAVRAAGIDPPASLTGSVNVDDYGARSFAFTAQRAGVASFTIKASNPQNYIPILPATTATALTVSRKSVPNGLAWSEQGQPEAVPPLNTLPVGSGTIYGMWVTRDALWIFASDGLWQLTGTGGAAGRGFDWSVINRDSTLALSAPHAACVLRDSVYAYTNRGVVSISSSGIHENISQGRLNDLLPGPPFSLTRDIQMWADETNDEIWLAVNATTSPVMYVYNTLTDAWTTHPGDSASTPLQGTYARFLQGVVTIDQNNAYAPDASAFAALVTDLQPVSDGAPMVMKAWIDETWVFAAASAGILVTPRWNGVDYAAAQRAAISQSQDARISWSIPRNAPANANTLAPGIRVAQSSTPLSLYGVGLRAVPYSDQRKQR